MWLVGELLARRVVPGDASKDDEVARESRES